MFGCSYFYDWSYIFGGGWVIFLACVSRLLLSSLKVIVGIMVRLKVGTKTA